VSILASSAFGISAKLATHAGKYSPVAAADHCPSSQLYITLKIKAVARTRALTWLRMNMPGALQTVVKR